MNAYLCGSCGQGVRHIDGRCCTCGGPFSPRPPVKVEADAPRERVALCGMMGTDGDGPCHLREGHPGLHTDGDARYV